MPRAWVKLVAVAAIAAPGYGVVAARADDAAAWLKDRQTRFASYRAAHPDPNSEIAEIKAKTAAIIATQAPQLGTSAAHDAERNGNDREGEAVLDSDPVIWRVSNTPVELWDGASYPKMIVIPAGEYTMGSRASELDRQASEGPRRRIRIGYSFAVGQFAVTVGEYGQFVADTRHDAGEACFTLERGEYRLRGNRDWRRVGFEQSGNSPVGCTNWYDAQAYVAWLSKKSRHTYRLLSEAEYEYANRAGSVSAYWWGEDVGKNRTVCNGCGSDFDNRRLATVGSFAPNAFGLYDTTGNSWSWLADCWNANYAGAPADGSANNGGDCDLHVMRGGSVHSPPRELRSAARSRHWFSLRNVPVGFRVARTL
jgi:formylglycine-generating enzyme required for sulfatase activity